MLQMRSLSCARSFRLFGTVSDAIGLLPRKKNVLALDQTTTA
jgi:hypothetical protein